MAKVRQGFVSNSSSASFLIYGIELEPNNIPKEKMLEIVRDELNKLDKIINKAKEDMRHDLARKAAKAEIKEMLEEEDMEGLRDYIEIGDLVEGTDLTHESVMGEFDFIGKSPTTIPDNKTMGEWKKEVKEEIESLGIDASDINWQKECWRDG